MQIDQIKLQLERLRRHHEVASNTYDHVSLLDLSHALRIWTELKNELPKLLPGFSTTLSFKTASPSKKALKQVRGYQHVFSYMAGQVVTHAHKGNLTSGPDYGDSFSFACRVYALNEFRTLKLSNFCAFAQCADERMVEYLKNESVTRCGYVQWLGSDIVRMCYKNSANQLVTLSLSREILIKRVANTLDGSHPSSVATAENKNKFDEPIHYLLQFSCGGLPLPYLILLKIAQDILEIVPKFLPETVPS